MKPPTITNLEQTAVDVVLGMTGGYVLGFSDRTLAHFMADFGVDIDDARYGQLSKAKRLREFFRSESPDLVGRVLQRLLEERGERPGDDDLRELVGYRALLRRLQGHAPMAPLPQIQSSDEISTSYVRELEAKLTARLGSGDYEGAITASRTLLEEVLGALEQALTLRREDYKGDLPRQYKAVAKRLRIDDDRTDLDDRFKDVVRGLVQVVNGLSALSNAVSDRHARKKQPAPHHAHAVTSAARIAATFLVESYLYQVKNGALPPASRP